MKKIFLLLMLLCFSTNNSFCEDMALMSNPLANVPYHYGLASSWVPSISEDASIHFMSGDWMFMLHGALFAGYTWQDVLRNGSRFDQEFSFPNWFMLMGEHQVLEKNRFLFKTMFSFEPLTESNNGYPLIFQTGEAFNDTYLIDRQHPHDLISELSVSYEQFLVQDCNLFVYLALPGEPALGPPSFMHRPSAKNNPNASLGHHWQDSTHITYGVATLGFQYSFFKIEGSAFNGREPDQDRFNIDTPSLDSWSARFSFNPLPSTAAQISYGCIKSPDALDPAVDAQRITFSVININELQERNNIATSFIWGMNIPSNSEPENSFLLESDMEINKSHSVYCRFEAVQKEMSELGIFSADNKLTYINALTLGTAKKLANMISTDIVLSMGAQATINFVGEDLKAVYGSYPLSLQIYFKLAPGATEEK